MQKIDAVNGGSLVNNSPWMDKEDLIKAGSCIYDWKDTLLKVGALFLLYLSLGRSQNCAPVLCGLFLLDREQDFSRNGHYIVKEIESINQKLTDISSSFSTPLERKENLQEEQRRLNVKSGHLQKERGKAIQAVRREAKQVEGSLSRDFQLVRPKDYFLDRKSVEKPCEGACSNGS